MRMMKPLSFLCLLCICPNILMAGSDGYSSWFQDIKGENSGHTVANFLSLPSSAAELGGGSASFCGAMDATDASFYTANTALFDRRKFAVTHLEWLMGLRKEFAAACFPFEDAGTAGVFSQVFTPGSFDNARDIDQNASNPSLVDYAVGLSFARNFFDKKLSGGVAISYVESRLDNNVGRTVSAGGDVTVIPSLWLRAHAYAGNASPGLSYTSHVPEPLPLQAGCALSISPLAFQEELSAIIDPKIGLGVKKVADEPLNMGAGVQATLFKFLAVRAGYDYVVGIAQNAAGLSVGVGLEHKSYGVDLGWRDQSVDLGSVWSASLKMQLQEMVPKKADDDYGIAEQFFKNGNFRQSLRFAKKALDLDPNCWKAHVLISTINALERRENGLEMAVIYTGNTRGQFVPIALPEGSLGGLARQATVIRRLRAQFPLAIAIDAGNCITQTSHKDKAKIADAYFENLAYDAMAIGKGEMDFGLPNIFSKDKKSKTQYICTNIQSTFATDVITRKVLNTGGYSFFVMGIVGPSMPGRNEDKEKLDAPINAIASALMKSAAKSATLRILIANDSWENITTLARSLPLIDIILCGNIRQKFEVPMKIGNTLVLSPGDQGCAVGRLVLRFDGDKKLVSCENHCIPLTAEIPLDPAVESTLRSIIAGMDIQEFDGTQNVLKKGKPDGVFSFLSNRSGKPGIYLKILDKRVEFPLTGTKAICAKPVLSFSGGKIAYFEKSGDTACPALRLMDISGVNKRTIDFAGCISELRFSPDGKWLYFTGRTDSTPDQMYRIKPEGSTAYPIISWKNSSQGPMDFSPDGGYMVFMSNGNGKSQLFLTDSVGQKPVCITEGNADNTTPGFSPSGASIAFLSNKTSFGGSYDLWLYDCASGKASQISFRSKVKDYCWLDDSKTIVFSGGDTLCALYTLDIAAHTAAVLIARDSIKNYGETHPQTIGYGNTRRIIYTREYGNGDRKIHWVNLNGALDQCIVNSKGQDWLE
jgi:Tol biopolymer transport system component